MASTTVSGAFLKLRVRHSTLILGALVIMFLADGLNSILLNSSREFYQVSVFVRMIVEVYFLALLFHSRYLSRILLIMAAMLSVSVLGTLSGFLHGLYTPGEYSYFENIKDVNKLVFVFICWYTYKCYFPNADEASRLFRVFEYLILIQCAVIIISFLFELSVFAAYYSPDRGVWRFGYQGLIPAQNEISGFFIISFFYFLNKVVQLGRGGILLLIVVFAGLLTGTKVALILPIILTLYALGWLAKMRVYRTQFTILVSIMVALVSVFFVWEKVIEEISPTISYFAWQMQYGFGDSLLSLFLTGRDGNVRQFVTEVLPNFGLLNYVFGGHDRARLSLEMDVFEIFARFGAIGGITFYFFYLRLLLSPVRRLSLTHLLFVLVWLGVSATAGHLVFSAVNGTYLPILLLSFVFITKPKIRGPNRIIPSTSYNPAGGSLAKVLRRLRRRLTTILAGQRPSDPSRKFRDFARGPKISFQERRGQIS